MMCMTPAPLLKELLTLHCTLPLSHHSVTEKHIKINTIQGNEYQAITCSFEYSWVKTHNFSEQPVYE